MLPEGEMVAAPPRLFVDVNFSVSRRWRGGRRDEQRKILISTQQRARRGILSEPINRDVLSRPRPDAITMRSRRARRRQQVPGVHRVVQAEAARRARVEAVRAVRWFTVHRRGTAGGVGPCGSCRGGHRQTLLTRRRGPRAGARRSSGPSASGRSRATSALESTAA